ncbi:hypothetical protein SD074_06040 [Prolixibacter sp. SD074]|nr:hypothetical protein SD074_06040 [Prolixibacter sp. SD074]
MGRLFVNDLKSWLFNGNYNYAYFLFSCTFSSTNHKKHIPVFYWLVIVATTTLGTEISDFLDKEFTLGLYFK